MKLLSEESGKVAALMGSAGIVTAILLIVAAKLIQGDQFWAIKPEAEITAWIGLAVGAMGGILLISGLVTIAVSKIRR